MSAQWQKPRGIQERIVVRGVLVLETPTHLGNGDAEGPLDMPLLLDPLEGRALLTGTSIAGALRNYLRIQDAKLAEILFGAVSDEESHQSPLVVDDAWGRAAAVGAAAEMAEKPKVELRDGVAIDPQTRTAEAKKKFDIELLEAGTEFPLSFELVVLKERADELRQAFALTLQGLEKGEVRLGKRKRRGFGCCRVKEWCVHRYEVTTPAGIIAWLEGRPSSEQKGPDIASLLGVPVEGQAHRPVCTLKGTFVVDGSLLIRSGFGEADAPDFVHLRSKRNGKEVPVLSGTSLAGALRARALRIANTLGKDGKQITDNLFGYRCEKEEGQEKLTASKLWTEETVIENGLDLVHTRVKIDRFTGGSYPGALFSEQPVFAKLNAETTVKISVKLENPSDGEVGLLLLLLKDLWTGDLPLGGESSVGRGRLRGKQASLEYSGETWTFIQENRILRVEGDTAKLESFVKAFTEGEI